MTFKELGEQIGTLVEEKNAAYGDSVGKTGAVLRALYPDAIFPNQFEDLLLIVRMLDKIARLANQKDGVDLGGESPYSDLAGYSLLGLRKHAQTR